MVCSVDKFCNEEDIVSPIMSDALIFITMHMIGQPVDVHVKDGSVYNGSFYTASAQDNYGIVLKNAMMTKKGSQEVNIENGSLVDTLIVQGEDLVQVVAKGVPVPEYGIFGGEATSRKHNQSSVDNLHENMAMRHAEDGLDVKQHDDEKSEYEGPEIVDQFPATARLDDQSVEKHASEKSPYFVAGLGVSIDSTSILHGNHSIGSPPAKDLKLNPEAKMFTPSSYHQHVLAIPALVPGYILGPSMMVPSDASQQDFSVTEHAGIQPLMFVPGYYMHQNSPNDAVGLSGFSQLSLPPLLAQYQQAHLAKHQDHFHEPHQTSQY